VIAWLGSNRGLAVLLVASLGANLFLGGMVAGRIAGDVTQGSQTRRSIQAMLAALPDAKRELVRGEINAVMPQVRQQLAALQKARAALAEEMVKPAPDSGALERGFAAVQVHTIAIGAELQRAMVRALPGLSQEERRALVRALARRRSGGALPLP
jgi:uncharacterized membrane protein